MAAVCVFVGSIITGTLHLTLHGTELTITGDLSGIPVSEHGITVHESGDTSHACRHIGEHFNPDGKPHGEGDSPHGHAGDLGNIFGTPGITHINIRNHQLTLDGDHSVIGRSIAIHERRDDGKSRHGEKHDDGNEGRAIGCCVVGHKKTETETGQGRVVPPKH